MAAIDSQQHDVVIVGGGSTGSVSAARLSEDPTRSVLLLEAAHAHAHAHAGDAYPEVVVDGARVGGDADTDWGGTPRAVVASPWTFLHLAARFWAGALR